MKKYQLLPILFLLAACSSASEHFDSEATQGVGVKSLSEVNAMIDQGKLAGIPVEGATAVAPQVVAKPSSSALATILLSDQSLAQRQPEQHLRIWIAPFQDNQGNFHEGSIVHTLQRPSFWQMVG